MVLALACATGRVRFNAPGPSVADTRFAGEMALRGGHEARSLLMAGQYETYASIAFQGFHQRDVLFAGNAINDVYAFVDQAFDEQVCDIAHMFVVGGLRSMFRSVFDSDFNGVLLVHEVTY